jgi:hypothetical protein
MIEIYIVDGTEYKVGPKSKAKFLQDFPNAQLISGSSMGDIGKKAPDEINWYNEAFGKTWFGRGFQAASTTGEANALWGERSKVTRETVRKFVEAKKNEAETYVPSDRMQKFQKKYKERGSNWTAFYKGVKEDKMLMAELFVQSIGTQVGTLWDSTDAQLAAATGFATGAAAGFAKSPGDIRAKAIKAGGWGLAGGIGALTASMETALTFGELIEKELHSKNLEFNDKNIINLLEGPDGKSIRNRALGRGLTIGAIEGLTAGIAGAGTTAVLRTGTGLSTKLAATTAGVGIEAIGGGLGEVGGMLMAGQHLDPAEIGFEAITGTVTAPGSVGLSLLTYKPAKYKLNNETVSFEEMKDFVETATDMQIATANISMENDLTGLNIKANKKQTDAIINHSIDSRVTDINDRKKLVELEKQRQGLRRKKEREGAKKTVGLVEDLTSVENQIDTIIDKYEGAVGIFDYKTEEAITEQGKKIQKTRRDVNLKQTIDFLQANKKFVGKNVVVAEDNAASQVAFDKAINEWNSQVKDKSDRIEWKDVKNSDGFIVGDLIVVNKEVAGKSHQINVGGHELLHGIVAKHMTTLDNAGKVKLIKSWKSAMTRQQRKYVAAEIERRNEAGEGLIVDTTEEWLTIFSDGIKKGHITFNENVFSKLRNVIEEILRLNGHRGEFANGRQVYNFMKEYQASVDAGGVISERAQALAGGGVTVKDFKASKSETPLEAINKLIPSEVKTKAQYDAFISDPRRNRELFSAIMMEGGVINNYIRSRQLTQEEGDIMIQNVTDRVLGFNPDAIREDGSRVGIEGFGERIFADTRFSKLDAKKALAIKAEKKKKEISKDISETNKEGDVKMQIEDTDTSVQDKLETEDMSPAAQAKKKADKAKSKERVESEFRNKLGIETKSDLYNKVLDSAKKALLRAYEAGTSVRNIQRKLRDEANVYLFKSVKNFLGTKDYVKNLKKFREHIVKAVFTADLVQLERNVPDSDRMLTTFVKKLTSKQEVQDAVNQKLLPPSALNIIDKGTAVSLYKKKTPTEKQFLDFFYPPLINPVTGSRSGLRGTRKDGLAKAMAGALSYDATMEVAQDTEVAQKRADLAELKGESLAKDNLEVLAAAIGRDPKVKFSMSDAEVGINILEGRNKNDGYRGKNWQKFIDNPNIPNRTKLEVEEEYLKRHTEQNDAISNEELAKLDRTDPKRDGSYTGKKRKTKIRTYKKYEMIARDRAKKVIKDLGLSKEDYKVENLSEKDNNPDIRITRNGKTVLAIEIKGNTARGVSISFNYKKDGKGLTKSKRAAEKQETENYNKKEQSLIKDSNNVFDKMIAFVGESQTAYSRYKNLQITVEGVRKIKEKGLHLDIYKNKYFITTEDVANSYTQKKGSDGSSRTSHVIDLGNAGMFVMDNSSELKIKGLQKFSDQKVLIPLTARINFGSVNAAGTHRTVSVRMEPQLNSLFFDKQDVSLINKSGNKNIKFHSSKSKVASVAQDMITMANKARTTTHFSKSRGASIFDFDETVGISENFVIAKKGDVTRKIASDEWPIYGETLREQGYEFDFTDFNKVTKGKPGPLLQKMKNQIKKYGPKNVFILTARAPESQAAIHEWLESEGVNIPMDNVTGLGDSTGKAKAAWILDKYNNKNYNDIYFVDDALQNVKAVQNMFNQLDIKGKSVQAKIKFSKTMDTEFNSILEEVTGMDSKKRFSAIKGRKRGENKGKFRFFVPPSHEDFLGLLYNFMGKGKRGDAHRNFFEQALVRPLNRAFNELDTVKQTVVNDFKALNRHFPDIKSILNDKIDGDFTVQDAVRVYLWSKHEYDIPGLSITDQQDLIDFVQDDEQLRTYAETLNVISKRKDYVTPTNGWEAGDIRVDLDDATGRIGRADYLTEFNENVDVIFSEENLNKVEAIYGKSARSAIEDSIYRIKTGRNRPSGQNETTNKWMNFLNAAVGSAMFLNMRSALLQQLSIVNYINFGDNNIYAAGKAFANTKQYLADWTKIYNSDMLKQRRGGIQTDVNAADLTKELSGKDFTGRALLAKLLQLGFTPTQIGDSIAIATGGATFFRNRVKTYVKQGLTQKEAEAKAWTDFQDITQSTQQSARPDKVSQQQASPIGKIILNFQNITSQYNRLSKKAFLDIYNRRTSPGNTSLVQSDISNASRIAYYLGIQNLIFYSLQTALFAVMFDDDEEEDKVTKKQERIVHGTIDSILRGSGVWGAVVATLKNTARQWMKERDKSYNHDESSVVQEMMNVSPVLGIKHRHITLAEKELNYNKKVIKEMETFDIDNPMWAAGGRYVEGLTGAPTHRVYQKVQNMQEVLNNQHTAFQRFLMFWGWTQYNMGIENREVQEIKDKLKKNKKKKKKKKSNIKGPKIRGPKIR